MPSIKSFRRSILFRPLAALLATLLFPVLSWLDNNSSNTGMFRAAAQGGISGCSGDGSNKIITNFCDANGNPYSADLAQLESDAVNGYLGEHVMPATDAHVIYDYGRSDLRTAVRANMVSILSGIISKSPASRSTHEQNLYNWLSSFVQKNEITLYQDALSQYAAWANDPCTFTLDPVVASTYNLSYDGVPFCGSPLNSLFSGPPMPAESYFTSYGLRHSYAAPSDQYANFSQIVANTGADIGELAGIGTATAILLAGSLSAATISGVIAVTQAGIAGTAVDVSGLVAGVASAEALGPFVLAAGPAAIILIAVAIGVAAGEQAFSSEQEIKDLNNLQNTLTQVTNTPPDLAAFKADTSGLGSFKIQMTFTAATVPEKASNISALPTHQSTDLNFAILTNGSTAVSSVMNYKDWDGNFWTTQTWGGWFVEHCSGTFCPQSDSITGSIRYVDWSGAKWTATRLGNVFLHTKAVPASTDVDCRPNTLTGISAGTDFSNCKTYTSASIPVMAPGGTLPLVSLSTLAPPVFTNAPALSFIPGVNATQAITATGNPSPLICYTSGNLPQGFSLNGGGCGLGSFQLNNNGSAAVGSYTLTMTATGASAVTESFTVNVTQQLSITSPATLSGTAGFPVNFLVTTTGNPTPHLSLDSNFNLGPGLSFHDNGDGTATISGITTQSLSQCSLPNGNPCGIIASNSQGTVEQAFIVSLGTAPAAVVNTPTTATFYAGVPNTLAVGSSGATTPVSWMFANGGTPWISLQDNGDGTATLKGTPPVGTNGTFNFGATPVALGEGVFDEKTAFFVINVVNTPLFTTPNTATFTAGTFGSFNIASSQGSISALNTLPNGLSFSSGNPAGINGSAAAGTGGQYVIKLTADGGSAGSSSQDLNLNVYEAPNVTSANDAIFFVGAPGSLAVTTTGFPSLSSLPIQNPTPPTDPSAGKGMYFTATGLPASLHFSNLTPGGFASGTLNIQGTPLASDAGTHQVQITAQNGVGTAAHQALTLQVLPYNPTAPVNLLSNWVLTRDSSNNVIATVVLANNGSATAQNVTLASAKIGTVTGAVTPATVASIPAESTATFTITFPAASIGAHGSAGVLTLSGSYTGGVFNNSGRIALP